MLLVRKNKLRQTQAYLELSIAVVIVGNTLTIVSELLSSPLAAIARRSASYVTTSLIKLPRVQLFLSH